MLRSILVGLDGSPWSEAATKLAIDWALRFDARLLGLGVLDEPSIDRGDMIPPGAYAYKKHRDEALLAAAHRHVIQLLDEFRSRCASARVQAAVLEDIGDPADRILREAQRCDIVVLGRQTNYHFETQDRPDAILAHVLRASPRPVVVVPQELPGGRGILVAYGGARESARALQTFASLGIADGEHLDVVTVHRNKAEAEVTAALAGEFLTAHRVPHQLHAIVSETSAATVLLDEVRRRRPHLLVMGAHGHHPLRDLSATSATRAVLRECAVPAFVGA